MLLPWICLFIALAAERNSASAINNIGDTSPAYTGKPSAPLRRFFKRELKCEDGEYPGNQYCCKNCPAGTYVENDCQENHQKPNCQPCTDGKDYMDKPNGYHQCLLCKRCDPEQGEDVHSPCTVFRNTVCKCKVNFFCGTNSTQDPRSCDHCQPCTQCEKGVAESCTETRDTVCNKGSRYRWGLLAALILVAVGAGLLCVRCRQKPRPIYQPPTLTPLVKPYPSHLEDIDLETPLQDLADIMLHDDVVKCVRRMGLSNPTIDDIKNTNGQGREGRYQLLRSWYVQYGQMGALRHLIETLRNQGLNKPADDFIDILKRRVQP
ncbi:hypothetical protein XENTR_v10017871 [Xenopus tropicalis]|uniref:Tumor necrosis factor receptor superfamily member 6 n=1 Tax=Xenopus tropicalis TaxID=8364 RepID=A0A6I8PTW1_XENTR|nr:hypothetical protein XENTR_v10017871 [Xenopus tropicalis]